MELMEGLTLLSTSVQNNALVFWFLTALSFIVLLTSILLTVISVTDRACGAFFCSILFVVISLCLTGICLDGVDDPIKTIYKVTINESVSMVEFYERYEILDQDGLIFTITEKEVS